MSRATTYIHKQLGGKHSQLSRPSWRQAAPAAASINNNDARPPDAPWSLTTYYTKKKERKTDDLGRFIQSTEMLLEPLGWNADSQVRLTVHIVSRDAGMTEEQLLEKVVALVQLLPDMAPRFARWKPGNVARLALRVDEVAALLVGLRSGRFPAANLSAMAARWPQLLDMSVQQVERAYAQAGDLLGQPSDLEQLIEVQPALLDTAGLEAAVEEMDRLFGVREPAARAALLRCNTGLLDELQPLSWQSRGDRDAPS